MYTSTKSFFPVASPQARLFFFLPAYFLQSFPTDFVLICWIPFNRQHCTEVFSSQQSLEGAGGAIKAERQEKPVSTSPLLERTISLFSFLRQPAATKHFHFEVENNCGALYCNHCFYLVGQRHSVQRHNSSAAPDTMLLGQRQRGRPTHQRADKPSAFESLGAVLQEQSSSGSQRRRLQPLSPSLPCFIWIFPPCSSNSGPRINRVPRHTF